MVNKYDDDFFSVVFLLNDLIMNEEGVSRENKEKWNKILINLNSLE